MGKKAMGIIIPYYKNSAECEIKFQQLMQQIEGQLTDDMLLYIYEDGQKTEWLDKYKNNKNIVIIQNEVNKGVSYARNYCLDRMLDKCLYILFLDSDDTLSGSYLPKMCEFCADFSHDVIESAFNHFGTIRPFNKTLKQGGVASSAFKSSTIGKHRFDETLQIGEDTKFYDEVIDFSIHRKKYCPEAIYFYNFGANPNSLTMLHRRKEIGKEREENGK